MFEKDDTPALDGFERRAQERKRLLAEIAEREKQLATLADEDRREALAEMSRFAAMGNLEFDAREKGKPKKGRPRGPGKRKRS